MTYPNDRRKHEPEAVEMLSPEYLAMLLACGGEVRAEDRSSLSSPQGQDRRRRRDDGPLPPTSTDPSVPSAG